MEGQIGKNKLSCWRLNWEEHPSPFQVCCIQNDPKKPMSCFLSGGHYVLTKAFLTLYNFAGFPISSFNIFTEVEFRNI